MNIQNKESIFGKPILFEESIVFDLAGNPLPTSHPIIVFYDQDKDEYWYVGARSAIDSKGNKRVPFSKEIEINASESGLFKNDSLIDTSKVYRIDRQLFHSLNVANVNLYHLTKEISNKDIKKILNSICSNAYIGEIAISKIFVDDNTGELSHKLQYCGQEVIDEIMERLELKNKDTKIVINNDIFFGTKLECYTQLRQHILEDLNWKNNHLIHYFSETINDFTYSYFSSVNEDINGDHYTPDNRFNPFDESIPLDYKNHSQELEEEINRDKQKEKNLFKM